MILAHPYLIAEPVNWQGKPITRKAYIDELIDAGLDGIEVRYTYDKTSYRGCQSMHYLCTEYGCVNLKGLTTWEKAEALINVAHPDFREELIKEAEKMHIWRRSNKI